MRTLFIFRDCFESRYILGRLDKKRLVGNIILETGKNAKIRKLRSLFKSSFVKYPLVFLDLISLYFYNSWTLKNLQKLLGECEYPKDRVKLIVDDANQKKCLEFVNNYKPDLIFIYGTAILMKKFIKGVKVPILNIHEGLLPYYRNVHADFWAFIKKDYARVGVSVFFVDQGIDSGDIALQENVRVKAADSLIDVKANNLIVAAKLAEQAIIKYQAKNLKGMKQGRSGIGFHKTPGFKDLFRFYRDL